MGRRVSAAAAVLMLGCVGGVSAADLGAMPTKPPAAPVVPVAPGGPAICTGFVDFFTTACQLAWYGVRFYGTIDVGGNYMTNGAPFDPVSGAGLNWFPGKNSHGARWNLAPNGLSVSNVGVQIKEPLGAGWSFVGQLEAGFNSISWDLANSPGSVHENVGFTLLQQKAPGDGSGQGKFYNDLGFAGVSNDTWGTLTFGRQNDLMKDGILAYDAMGNAFAFSYIGFFGATGGGGDTENVKNTTGVKYRVNVGNFHFGVFGQIGGYDLGNASNGVIQGNVGADFQAGPGILSTEVIAGQTRDGVLQALAGGVSPLGVVNPFVPQNLAITISDNTNVMLLAKYTIDRLKLYAGYEWIRFAPPSDFITSFTDITGTFLCNNTPSTPCFFNGLPIVINNTAFNAKNKIQQTMWVGARYSLTDSVDVAAAYYHVDTNEFATGAALVNCQITSIANAACHGTVDAASFLIDWQFAPKWDTYAGVLWSRFAGGQASGFLSATPDVTNVSTTAGIRFRW